MNTVGQRSQTDRDQDHRGRYWRAVIAVSVSVLVVAILYFAIPHNYLGEETGKFRAALPGSDTGAAVAPSRRGAVTGAKIVSETIIYLHEDGRSHFDYSTKRTSSPSSELYVESKKSLGEYIYFYPKGYTVDDKADESAIVITFPEAGFAAIKDGYFDKKVTRDEDGVFTFKSWGGRKRKDGHFGFWTKGKNFTEFVYAWVFPDSFDIISYESNRKGDWILQSNTVSWYGENVNDITFTFKYRPHSQKHYDTLSTSLADTGGVKVEHHQHAVRVALEGAILFPAGQSELSPRGRALIRTVLKAFGEGPTVKIIVEGHTDNQPVSRKLSAIFSTNWELSTARALSVVHYLAELGFPEKKLEARAYGPYRPRASNETEEGRAQNHRIPSWYGSNSWSARERSET